MPGVTGAASRLLSVLGVAMMQSTEEWKEALVAGVTTSTALPSSPWLQRADMYSPFETAVVLLSVSVSECSMAYQF